jgi:hypothetical protein
MVSGVPQCEVDHTYDNVTARPEISGIDPAGRLATLTPMLPVGSIIWCAPSIRTHTLHPGNISVYIVRRIPSAPKGPSGFGGHMRSPRY